MPLLHWNLHWLLHSLWLLLPLLNCHCYALLRVSARLPFWCLCDCYLDLWHCCPLPLLFLLLPVPACAGYYCIAIITDCQLVIVLLLIYGFLTHCIVLPCLYLMPPPVLPLLPHYYLVIVNCVIPVTWRIHLCNCWIVMPVIVLFVTLLVPHHYGDYRIVRTLPCYSLCLITIVTTVVDCLVRRVPLLLVFTLPLSGVLLPCTIVTLLWLCPLIVVPLICCYWHYLLTLLPRSYLPLYALLFMPYGSVFIPYCWFNIWYRRWVLDYRFDCPLYLPTRVVLPGCCYIWFAFHPTLPSRTADLPAICYLVTRWTFGPL